ncbi:MAG TPA: S41 family peptidase [Anaerolineales bacterium]|nr:S41 family peptidase [Anaerolineales bacterium]
MNKNINLFLGSLIAIILLAGAFSGGFIAGQLIPSSGQISFLDDLMPSLPTVAPEQQSTTPDELKSLFEPFWEAWNIVHTQYVEQPVDDVKLMQGAIRGMMEALGDEQTRYMDPEQYENETVALQGEYEGIGAYVDPDGEYLTIVSPIEGSPAELAGLHPDDKIIAIDGVDMTGIPPEEVRLKVLGPEGSTVTLTIRREGEPEPLDFTITRARITIRSAEGRMLENDIAYVNINTFGERTTQELRTTLDTLMGQNPRGMIIDLRNNGGGYLTTAIEVSSEFIEEGVIMYEEYGDGRRDEYEASGNGQATEIPIVVLINQGSASASEILAGALQDYDRATLVGEKSYGKGSVQNWQPLSNDQGAARVTVAKWLTPHERVIDKIGLTPDVFVEMTPEDFTEEQDPQLDAAVETLLAILNGTTIPTSMPTPVVTPTVQP